MGLKKFLEDRTGLPGLIRRVFLEEVKGGARWAYVFGSCLVFLFILQTITGIVMALHYSPSSSQAWGSIAFFQQNLQSGWLIRGLHHWAASFIVILAIVHLGQVFLFGAYQKPREINWWTGVVLLIIIMGLALTGYLLPWDQRGYWSTNVVTNIIGTVPFVGAKLKEILIGGQDFGSLTLTHFYGLHVLILPFLFFSVLAVHLLVFRKHGVTTAWWRSPEEVEAKTEPFWPRQVFYDLVFSLFILIILGAWVIYNKGAPLGPPADPTSNYLARPEWYFLFLYQSLKYIKGSWEVFGTLVLPTAILVFLFTFPFMIRHQNKSPRSRIILFIMGGFFFTFLLSLTLISLREDITDPVFYYQNLEGQREADVALRLARSGIPPLGPLEMIEMDPVEHGRKIFDAYCIHCHTLDGLGGSEAAELTSYLSDKWLEGFLRHPRNPEYYGNTKLSDMDPVEIPETELKELMTYLNSLSQPDADSENSKGFAIYRREECRECHGTPGKTHGTGPNLAGFGSKEWMRSLIEDSSSDRFFGEESQMPPFKNVLSPRELDHLVEMLSSLKSE